jgi:hypothetical protein
MWIDMYFITESCAPHMREPKLEGDFTETPLLKNATYTHKELCVLLFDRFNMVRGGSGRDAGYTRKL